jgi:ABC-2 type transport system permease protein
VANVLPFKWTFGFPIEALVADLTTEQLLGGLAMQVFWIAVGLVVMRTAFRIAVKRYAAVGG